VILRPALLPAVVGLLLMPVPVSAQADDPIVEVCEDTVGGVICTSLTAGQVIAGDLCTALTLPPETCAALAMNPVVDAALVADHESSWLARAHALQERLDDGEPLLNTLIIQTHNSNNAAAYDLTVTGFDPNQLYAITDQLRMNMRGIELDLHWVPSPFGTVETGGRAVVLCHGQSQAVGDVVVHVGCSNDRPFDTALVELRAWLDDHPGTFLLLYLENQMEDDPVAHDLAAAGIAEHLGGLVHRPVEKCAPVDWTTTQDDLLDAGTPVLIVGNCGAGGDWGTWVHERGERWREGGSTDTYPAHPDCVERRGDPDYDENFIRTWEDATWLSAVAGSPADLTPAEAGGMVNCGLDLIGLDRLVPFDPRLQAMVWSWDVDEPLAESGGCAERQVTGRFRTQDCEQELRYACHGQAGWFVPDIPGPWATGFATCEQAGGMFRTPPTGWENTLLSAAGADAVPVWLNYQSLAGEWESNTIAVPVSGGPGATPATGGGLAVVGLLLLSTAVHRTARRLV